MIGANIAPKFVWQCSFFALGLSLGLCFLLSVLAKVTMGQATVSISIDELRVGVTCSHPIEDDNGVLLLGSNTSITHQLINGLRDREIDVVEIDPRDLAALRNAKKKLLSKKDRKKDDQWEESRPVKEMLVDRHDEGLNEERAEELKNSISAAKNHFDELKTLITEEKIRSIGMLSNLSNSYARSMVDDHDLTVGVITNLSRSSEPSERSVKMAVLGMAVAIELGLDGQQTLEVGMTALLHDIGLYAMDERFLQPVELMTEAERWEYRKHPFVSLQVVADAMEVSYSVQLAIQQVHEQFDGSGYPRGVKGPRIHVYARILNVVDTYLRLTSATSHRQAIVPHDALGLMLHQAARGIFDPKVVRAFLNIETLYPLGSMVELDSGEVARVIRRPRSGFAAPVLIDSSGNRIELESTNQRVVRPVCDPSVPQMRITPDLMQTSSWHPALGTPLTV